MEIQEHDNLRKGFFARAYSAVTGNASNRSRNKRANQRGPAPSVPPKPVKNEIKFELQRMIQDEMGKPLGKSNILYLPGIFDSIMTKIVGTITGSSGIQRQASDTSSVVGNTTETASSGGGIGRRPIEIDAIQTIVGLVNSVIDEANLELEGFDLALSRNLLLIIHSLVLLFLICLYFLEQRQHFTQTLKTLDTQKPSLLNYMISMVVPDASCDMEGGELFAKQFLNTLRQSLTTRAEMIIMQTLQNQQNLSRKELQVICDGKLINMSDQAMINYIEKPTESILEEFQSRWENIEALIETHIKNQKNSLKISMISFFSVIRSMYSSLIDEGPALRFIDDLFLSTAGTAEENLKNKGQCMVLLLFTYLRNAQINSKTFFSVYKHIYTVTEKGVKYFQKLTKPDAPLVSLIDLMSPPDIASSSTAASGITVQSGGAQIRVTSIKNFSSFLKSILAIETNIMKEYDAIPTELSAYDKDQTHIKLQSKAQGCPATCKKYFLLQLRLIYKFDLVFLKVHAVDDRVMLTIVWSSQTLVG